MNRKLNVTIFQKDYNDVWEVMAKLVESCLLWIEGSARHFITPLPILAYNIS